MGARARRRGDQSLDGRCARPGLALALVDQGEVVFEHAYGSADRDAGVALRTDTVMYAASLTKAAFAYLVMLLVDAGVLTLDAPITTLLAKPLPDYSEFADLAGDPRWQRLTPRSVSCRIPAAS